MAVQLLFYGLLLHDLFKIARIILVQFQSNFSFRDLINTDMAITW